MCVSFEQLFIIIYSCLTVFLLLYIINKHNNNIITKDKMILIFKENKVLNLNWNNLLLFVQFFPNLNIYPLQIIFIPKPDPCEQPHEGHLTSKLKYRRFSSYLLCTLLIFPFRLLPSLGTRVCHTPSIFQFFGILTWNIIFLL